MENREEFVTVEELIAQIKVCDLSVQSAKDQLNARENLIQQVPQFWKIVLSEHAKLHNFLPKSHQIRSHLSSLEVGWQGGESRVYLHLDLPQDAIGDSRTWLDQHATEVTADEKSEDGVIRTTLIASFLPTNKVFKAFYELWSTPTKYWKRRTTPRRASSNTVDLKNLQSPEKRSPKKRSLTENLQQNAPPKRHIFAVVLLENEGQQPASEGQQPASEGQQPASEGQQSANDMDQEESPAESATCNDFGLQPYFLPEEDERSTLEAEETEPASVGHQNTESTPPAEPVASTSKKTVRTSKLDKGAKTPKPGTSHKSCDQKIEELTNKFSDCISKAEFLEFERKSDRQFRILKKALEKLGVNVDDSEVRSARSG